ncbi:iron ABC transporter permease [Senegalimassilia anaerobia]|uniref:FecCD family ABC transporter permease n=1 Tax=Senegalimassilia anaerobia TaxID=1473216 RepID=UPI0026EB1653|nr:iron ABC transporter permease [Senegalimassilia anaerobia]
MSDGSAAQPGARDGVADAAPVAVEASAREERLVGQLLGSIDARADVDDAAVRDAADKTFGSKVSFKVKLLILLAVVAAFFFSFMMGKYAMTPVEVCQTFWAHFFDPANVDPKMDRVLFRIRLPRVGVVMLVGAALAVAGASYQGMFKNPLTSPDLLGASAGASLGACLALLWGLAGEYVQLFAFLGGMLAVGMAVWLNRQVDYDPTLGLVLAGILVSTLFQSGMSMVKFLADADDKLPTITFWLMGSFANVNAGDFLVSLLPMLIGFAILMSQSWKLNVLSFGDEEARAMGVKTRSTRLLVIFASTLITSASVAVAGIVGWIGLVIPHLARAIVGPNYKVLLPCSMVVGAVYLLLVDNIARLAMTVEVPIGILTAILGVPFFVVIFKHNMKGWR